MSHLSAFVHEPRVAYFSMEIALRNEIPTYSGGLGVLAGDSLRSAADMHLPMVAVTLVSRAGYFHQAVDAGGRQHEQPAGWNPADWAEPLPAKVAIEIEGRSVWIRGWLYILEGHMDGREPVILLDTDLDENNDADRELTHYLYGGDPVYRLKQEIVLGIGGERMLQALGFEVLQYHMNEGHSALLVVELLNRYAYAGNELRPGESPYNLPRVRELCCFTTHTPVEAGHDRFPYDLVLRVLGEALDPATLKHLAGDDELNMTRLALNMSEYVNGVARRHAEQSRKMFPGYHVSAVTNGVHPRTWTCPEFTELYDRVLPGWCHEPALLRRADCCLDDEAVRAAHGQAKRRLIDHIQSVAGEAFDPAVPVLGFARRMTAYKRADLLFTDVERLKAIARRYPFQLVFAGKAHPNDHDGKHLIEQIYRYREQLSGSIPVVFLPGYDMAQAQLLVAGVDIWLNTPLRPLEASGTSGMKAAFNGVPQLSVLDGWWVEGCIEGVTGWAIGDDDPDANGDDARALYDKLEHRVLALYYADRPGWIRVMKAAIAKNASHFNSHRMMRRYVSDAYIH